MALSLEGNSKDVVNQIAVGLVVGLIVLVCGAAFYDKMRNVEDSKQRRPAAWVLTLLISSYLLLIPALFVTLFNMTIGAVDALVLEQASDSTLQFIHLLGDTGSWVGAVLVTIFAIMVPLVKIVLLVLGEIWRGSPDPRKVQSARMYIHFVQIISKWACPDIVAYIFLFYLVKHLDRDPINGFFSLDVGFTCYTLFCWGSTISSLGVHLPPLPSPSSSSPSSSSRSLREPWALRILGTGGTAVAMLLLQAGFVACFVLGLTWSCLGLRLEENILQQNGLPQWQIDLMKELHVAEHAKADVTIFQCIEMLVKTQAESFDANAILSIIMLAVFVLGLTALDMVILAVACVQLLPGTRRFAEGTSCNLVTLAKQLKKLAMLDVLILGIVVVVLSGSVYEGQGLVLSPGWGLLALAGAEVMHYMAYGLVRCFVRHAPAGEKCPKEMSEASTTDATDSTESEVST